MLITRATFPSQDQSFIALSPVKWWEYTEGGLEGGAVTVFVEDHMADSGWALHLLWKMVPGIGSVIWIHIHALYSHSSYLLHFYSTLRYRF